MFCTKCGNELPEGAKFCTSCGAAMEAPAVAQEDTAPESPVEAVQETPEMPAEAMPVYPDIDLNTQGNVKKKKSKTPLLIGIGVIAVALIALIALNFSTILSWFGVKPEPKTELNNVLKDSINAAFDEYGELLDSPGLSDNKPVATATSIKLSVNEEVLDMLAPAIGLDAASLKTVIDGISIDAISTVKDNKTQVDMALNVDGTELITLASIVDMDNYNMYYSIPAISEQAICLSLMAAEGIDSASMTQMQNLMKPDRIKTIALRYVSIIVDGLTAVERTTETITAESVSQELTVLKCRLTEKDALKIGQKILETLKIDKDVKSLLEEMVGTVGEFTPEEIYQLFVESLDESLAELNEMEIDEDSEELTFDVYLSGDDFAGLYMQEPGGEEEILIVYVKDGEDYGFEMNLASEMEITGSGKDKGKKGISGKWVIAVEGDELITIVMENVVETETAASGTVTLSFGDSFYDLVAEAMGDSSISTTLSMVNPSLKVTTDSTMEKGTATLAVTISGTEMVQIIIESEQTEAKDIVIPENYVDVTDEEAMEQWLEDSGLMDLIGGLM